MGSITSACYDTEETDKKYSTSNQILLEQSQKEIIKYESKTSQLELEINEYKKIMAELQHQVTKLNNLNQLNDEYDQSKKAETANLKNKIEPFKCIQSSSATQSGTSNGKNKINQDSFICIDRFGPSSVFQLYGVCDGHGPNGNIVSKYVSDKLPNTINKLLIENEIYPDNYKEISIMSILKESFGLVENELFKLNKLDINYSGTTVTLGLFAGNKLYVSNIGDSRTVLGVITKNNKTVPSAIALSTDHDANNLKEVVRINKSLYGKIISDNYNDKRIEIDIAEIKDECDVHKVSVSVSRSLGDKIGHKYGGLVSEAEITVHNLCNDDIFVIFASDGIWQMIDNNDVMRVIGTKLKKNKNIQIYEDLQKYTNKLVKEANILWMDEYDQYTDDITCVIARVGKIK